VGLGASKNLLGGRARRIFTHVHRCGPSTRRGVVAPQGRASKKAVASRCRDHAGGGLIRGGTQKNNGQRKKNSGGQVRVGDFGAVFRKSDDGQKTGREIPAPKRARGLGRSRDLNAWANRKLVRFFYGRPKSVRPGVW